MIASKQNDKIKFIRSLYQKKSRDEHGVFLVEGVKSVKEAALKGARIQTIVATEKCAEFFADKVDLLVSDEVFKSISGEVSPQGVLAVVEKPKLSLRAPKGSCLFLDGLQDPSNVGAIIRTAAAAGYTDIYMAKPCADAYSDKAVRASMSGIFIVNLFEGEKEELLSYIDLPVVVASMDGENAFESDIDENVCIVIGNEGNGVSKTLKDRASRTVKIPMQNGMESLNAAVCAGILMYALKKNKGE